MQSRCITVGDRTYEDHPNFKTISTRSKSGFSTPTVRPTEPPCPSASPQTSKSSAPPVASSTVSRRSTSCSAVPRARRPSTTSTSSNSRKTSRWPPIAPPPALAVSHRSSLWVFRDNRWQLPSIKAPSPTENDVRYRSSDSLTSGGFRLSYLHPTDRKMHLYRCIMPSESLATSPRESRRSCCSSLGQSRSRSFAAILLVLPPPPLVLFLALLVSVAHLALRSCSNDAFVAGIVSTQSGVIAAPPLTRRRFHPRT